MPVIHSSDGTRIVFDQSGSGPALILVGGMFEYRAFNSETAQLAQSPLLNENFTVFHYDRRGRGESGNTLPFALEREIEDIETLIDHAGGEAFLFGMSSGAALAFEAALMLGHPKVKKLALYEPPYNDADDARQTWQGFHQALQILLADDRKSEAVALFMSLLGVPDDHIEDMQADPSWPQMESVAATIAYDVAALGKDASVPADRATQLQIPSLLLLGEESPYPFMQLTADRLAKSIPNARVHQLAGQSHEVQAEALVPFLIDFFKPSASD